MSKIKIMGNDSNSVSLAIKHLLNNHLSSISACNKYDLLILTQNSHLPYPKCRILLLPDELISIPACDIAVSYGMSLKCSVTLSATGKKPVLAIQRELVTLKGKTIEPQEIPLKNPLFLSKYPLMATSAALLIMGVSPEKLS